MLSSKSLFTALILAAGITLSTHSLAEPWIDTSDIYLKANIQLLADTGYIITPVTTYPLMWHDINRDIKNIDITNLSSNQQNAYHYINHQFKLANRNQTRLKVQVGVENKRFTSFGDQVSDKNSISVHSSILFDNFAVKFAPSYTQNPVDGDKTRLDESYIAAYIGNWVLSLGRQNRWYGPTWDTSLSLTNNARPITAFAISRKSAKPFIVPFTEFDIPWTVTSFMGKMDDERVVKNTLLWGFRLNLKPFKNLELGITRLAQWGGDGRSTSLSTFGDILLGKSNCGIDDVVCNESTPNPANQQAGYDLRYSFNLFDTPMSFYGQKFAEDGSEGTFNYVTKAQPQIGFDAHLSLWGKPSTVFIELADSLADCGENRDNIGDCYYEHSSYKTGMRYNGRTIGSTYENDAKTYVLGAISQLGINTRLTTKIRYLDLNYDNQDKAPDNPLIGNTVSSIAEQVWMVSSSVLHDYKNWRFTLAAEVSQSTFDNDISNETDFNASFMVEYNL
ncbi:MAG: capsule assembly Wzi family protein [Colwellia sp.]|nr:capsule assembly Wzi family protein [Colwellia sp.]